MTPINIFKARTFGAYPYSYLIGLSQQSKPIISKYIIYRDDSKVGLDGNCVVTTDSQVYRLQNSYFHI